MRLVLLTLIVLLFNSCLSGLLGASLPAVPGVQMSDISSETPSDQNTTRIELDIFSGRPNPTWRMSRADTQTLARMVETLSRSEPKTLFDGLGYRGFIVTSPTPIAGATTITVQNEIVKLSADNFRLDPKRTIERWLLTKAEPELPNDVYELAKKEIEAGHK